MKKIFSGAALIFVCFLLQSTVFAQFNIGGIVPNLLIIVTASLGFLCGKKTGIIVGFSCGILMDFFLGSVYGMNGLLYMYVGYCNGLFKKILYPKDIKLPLVLIAGSDIGYGVFFYFFRFLLRGKFDFPYYFTQIIIPETVYTTILACLIYPLIHSIKIRLDEKEKKGEQSSV